MVLFSWTEAEFLTHTEGSPIRRIGYQRWQRNVAVAMGNALRAQNDPEIRRALQQSLLKPLSNGGDDADNLVREHVVWALARAA